jgi:hypothetical protein
MGYNSEPLSDSMARLTGSVVTAWNAYHVCIPLISLCEDLHRLPLQCDIDESIILETARLMKALGLSVIPVPRPVPH